MGKGPREALRDPDLAFNLTVMRGHDLHLARKFRAVAEVAAKKDGLGLNRIYQALRLIHEDC